MTFTAGQKIRAGYLRDFAAVVAYAVSDSTKTASTALSDAADLAVALDASSYYAIDGYLAYDCAETPDLAVSLYGPSDATGHWGLFALTASSTGGIGSAEGYRLTNYSSGTTGGAAGSSTTSMLCQPHGYIATTAAGILRVQFSQVVSTGGSDTTIKAGSWLRATKMA